MSDIRNGNRQRLPKNALRVCASCLSPRGNVRRGWEPIASAEGQVVGYTCPECPTYAEPIRREDSGRFLAVVGIKGRDGKRRQIKRRFDRLDVAREWVAETRAGAEQTLDYDDPSRMTVSTLCERWLARRSEEVGTPGGIREVTLNGYESGLESPLRYIGHYVAREVSTDDIESMLRSLAITGGTRGRPLKHGSIVYALTALRQAFNYGMRQGWLKANPTTLAKPPRQQHGSDRDESVLRWSPAELATFRAEIDRYGDGQRFAAEPWLTAGMRLTLTGMRRSEVLGLDWQRVDLDAGTVEVAASRVKTGRGNATALGEVKVKNSLRVVSAEIIHPGTTTALRKLWFAQGRPSHGLVVCNSVGDPVAPDTYSLRFRALCEAAGLAPLRSIHNVRHTIATALQAASLPDHEAAALLGHDVNTYRRFYLVTDNDGAAAAAAVAGRLFAV